MCVESCGHITAHFSKHESLIYKMRASTGGSEVQPRAQASETYGRSFESRLPMSSFVF